MFKDLLFILWFSIPVILANTAPIFAAKFPPLRKFNYPLDFYKKCNGKRIFGSHKTIRGLMIGVIVSIVIVYLQIVLYKYIPFIRNISQLNYTEINPILLGCLLGFGTLFGDAAKSFFKRQLNIAPGATWFPFDQIDLIIGNIVFTYFYIPLTLQQYLIAFVLALTLHPIGTFIGWTIGIKEKPI